MQILHLLLQPDAALSQLFPFLQPHELVRAGGSPPPPWGVCCHWALAQSSAAVTPFRPPCRSCHLFSHSCSKCTGGGRSAQSPAISPPQMGHPSLQFLQGLDFLRQSVIGHPHRTPELLHPCPHLYRKVPEDTFGKICTSRSIPASPNKERCRSSNWSPCRQSFTSPNAERPPPGSGPNLPRGQPIGTVGPFPTSHFVPRPPKVQVF